MTETTLNIEDLNNDKTLSEKDKEMLIKKLNDKEIIAGLENENRELKKIVAGLENENKDLKAEYKNLVGQYDTAIKAIQNFARSTEEAKKLTEKDKETYKEIDKMLQELKR